MAYLGEWVYNHTTGCYELEVTVIREGGCDGAFGTHVQFIYGIETIMPCDIAECGNYSRPNAYDAVIERLEDDGYDPNYVPPCQWTFEEVDRRPCCEGERPVELIFNWLPCCETLY